jgi:hypothetical protein
MSESAGPKKNSGEFGLVYSQGGAPASSKTRVGDGGKSWRARLAKRKHEQPSRSSSKSSSSSSSKTRKEDFYFHKAGKHIAKKQKKREGGGSALPSSSTYPSSRDRDRDGPSDRSRAVARNKADDGKRSAIRQDSFSSSSTLATRAALPSPSRPRELRELSNSGYKNDKNQVPVPDVNKLAAQAMKAKLKGKMKLYARLQAEIEGVKSKMSRGGGEKEKSKSKGHKQRDNMAPPNVDLHGRKLVFRDSGVKVCGNREGASSSVSSSSSSSSIKQLLEEERLNRHDSRHDADRQFARYVMKTGAVDFDGRNADRFQEKVEEHGYSEGKNLTNKQKQGRGKMRLETTSRSKGDAYAQLKREEALLDSCVYCVRNPKCQGRVVKHLILSMQEHWSVSIPVTKRLNERHLLITPADHIMHCTALSDQQREGLADIQTAIARQWRGNVVFFQTVHNIKRNRHLVIHAVGIDSGVAQQAPIFFSQALQQCDGEWSTHQKVIDTSSKSLYGSVPSSFPYFHVSFGGSKRNSMAHVIEDQDKFSEWFAYEVMCEMLEEPWQFLVRDTKRKGLQFELSLVKKFKTNNPGLVFK